MVRGTISSLRDLVANRWSECLCSDPRPSYKPIPFTVVQRQLQGVAMSRRIRKVLIAAFMFGLSSSGVASAGDKGPCKIATKGDSPTAKACTKGGRDAATKLMKDMVKQAKGKGEKLTCDGCDKDHDNYELTKNANEDYKKLPAVIAKN